MKTAVIYNEAPENIYYLLIEGDHRSLNGIYINGDFPEDKIDNLNKLLFNEDGYLKRNKMNIDELRSEILDGAFLIEVGFYL